MIHTTPPEGFSPKFEVACCYVQHRGKLLLLLRNAEKDEGNKWGTPGGKVEAGETHGQTVVREVGEEIGLLLPADRFVLFGSAFVRYPQYDFIFHEYSVDLDEPPSLSIKEDEHQEARWVTPEEALTMPLVMGNDILLKRFYGLN